MALTRDKADWRRTSVLAAWVCSAIGANVDPSDIDPYASREIVGEITAEELADIAESALS